MHNPITDSINILDGSINTEELAFKLGEDADAAKRIAVKYNAKHSGNESMTFTFYSIEIVSGIFANLIIELDNKVYAIHIEFNEHDINKIIPVLKSNYHNKIETDGDYSTFVTKDYKLICKENIISLVYLT